MANFNLPGNEYQANPADVEENKILSILCYFGILFLIPYFVKKDSQYIKFHANQGLILFILNIVLGIVSGILGAILGAILGDIGVLLSTLLGSLISIVTLVLMILGIVNAVTGKMKELPLIGSFRILK